MSNETAFNPMQDIEARARQIERSFQKSWVQAMELYELIAGIELLAGEPTETPLELLHRIYYMLGGISRLAKSNAAELDEREKEAEELRKAASALAWAGSKQD